MEKTIFISEQKERKNHGKEKERKKTKEKKKKSTLKRNSKRIKKAYLKNK